MEGAEHGARYQCRHIQAWIKPISGKWSSGYWPVRLGKNRSERYIGRACLPCMDPCIWLKARQWLVFNETKFNMIRSIKGSKKMDHRRKDVLRMRSEEHTYELQSLMRIQYDVFCI